MDFILDLLHLKCLCHIKVDIYLRLLEMSLKFEKKVRVGRRVVAPFVGAMGVNRNSQGEQGEWEH